MESEELSVSRPCLNSRAAVQTQKMLTNFSWTLATLKIKWWRPQRKISCQLFTKNTAPCELVRGCIWGDA